jgi:hypothetical protein
MKYTNTLFTNKSWSITRAILLFLSFWSLLPLHYNDYSKCKGSSALSTKVPFYEQDSHRASNVAPFYASSRNVFFSYGSIRYRAALKRIVREANETGVFDEVIGFGPEDIDPEYRIDHADVLNGTRGGGFWLWKPYFLKRVFSQLDYGDVVMYADAGCEFISSPQVYIDLARRHGFVGFRMIHPHNEYTKGDIFQALDMDMDIYGNEGQLIATIWLFQKNSLNERFVADWLQFSEDAQLITDAASKSPNHPNFVDNRHDQSIFGLLVIKYNLGVVLKDQTWPREKSLIISASKRRHD